jgi:hypothetical protein
MAKGAEYTLGFNGSVWNRGLQKAGRGFKGFGRTVAAGARSTAGSLVGLVGAFLSLQAAIKMERIQKMFNLTAGELTTLSLVVAKTGIPMEMFTNAMKELGQQDPEFFIGLMNKTLKETARIAPTLGKIFVFVGEMARDMIDLLIKGVDILGAFSDAVKQVGGVGPIRMLTGGGIGAFKKGLAKRRAERQASSRAIEERFQPIVNEVARQMRQESLPQNVRQVATLAGNQPSGAFAPRLPSLVDSMREQEAYLERIARNTERGLTTP